MSEQNDVKDDELEQLSQADLARMVREKRKAEASYRTRLRDAEAELGQLRETVTGWQSSQLSTLAAAAGIAETALGDVPAHVPLESVVGEGGLLDAEKVDGALKALKSQRPHLFQPEPAARGTGTPDFGGEGEQARSVSWADVI
jgi:hypothetical protein